MHAIWIAEHDKLHVAVDLLRLRNGQLRTSAGIRRTPCSTHQSELHQHRMRGSTSVRFSTLSVHGDDISNLNRHKRQSRQEVKLMTA